MGKHNISTIMGRTRRVRGAVGLAAIAAATVGGALIGTSSSDAATTTTKAAAATPSAATRAHIPWSKVGSGWLLSTLDTNNGRTRTLYLLDAVGHRYRIAGLPKNTTPIAWSGDGRRALLVTDVAPASRDVISEVNLQTGARHVVSNRGSDLGNIIASEGGRVLSYTRPHGLALLAAVYQHTSGDPGRLERFGLDGQRQLIYPASVKGAGRLDPDAVIETSDGGTLVIASQHGMVELRNNGSVLRRIGTKPACDYPIRMWNATSVLAGCADGSLMVLPLSGAKGHRVTAVTPAGHHGKAIGNVWTYSKGTLGEGITSGSESLVKVGRTGHGTRVSIPTPRGSGRYLDELVAHDRALVEGLASTVYPFSGRSSVFVYNAVTKHSKALLGPGATVGTVSAVVAFPASALS